MTAEITILNRSAIVLAADSAVTVQKGQEQNIYHTANKLFMLSKYHPVGIMIYQKLDLMGVPWETIIKLYRKKLRKREFNKLIDYQKDFTQFLCDNRVMFPEDLQINFFKELAKKRLADLRGTIRKDFEKASEIKMKAQQTLTAEEIQQIFIKAIDTECALSRGWQILPSFVSTDKSQLIQKHEAILSELIKSEFQEAPLSDDLKVKLKESVVNYFVGNWFMNYSGVVIAGFGKDDVFPSYVRCWIECVFENKLKYFEFPCKSSNEQTIEFFAQSEKGMAFVTGVDDDLFKHSEKKFSEFKQKLENEVEGKILNMLGADKKAGAKNVLQGLINQAAKEYTDSIGAYIKERKVMPIARTIGVLSKDELASVAESLISLTSLKKRVSGEPETVGGPVDVAVISKGDGFIWMKRKHYFDPKLNHHFLTNYYFGDEDEE